MKSAIVVIALLIFCEHAFAAPGGGSGASASAMKNSGSMFGLCTKPEGNDPQNWMKQGYCQAVEEKIREANSCLKVKGNLVDTILGNQKALDSMKEFCPNVDFKANKDKFVLFFKQIVAALTIEESTWKDNITSSMGAKGLMQLSRKSVAGYAKCDKGCAQIAKTGRIGGSREANMNNMTCGTTIALYWIAKDGTLGGGSGNKGSRGIARYFQPYRNIDKVKRERMKKKVANYCNKQLNQEPYQEDRGGQRSGTLI